MEEHLIEIYNENLESIGKKLKKDIDKSKDIFKVAIVFLFNKNSDIFMTEPQNNLWPGKIGASSEGPVHHAESSYDAAQRIIKKDLSIDIKLIPLEEKYYNLNGIKRILSFFYGKINSQPKINKKEIKNGKWLNQKEIENMIKHNNCIPTFLIGYDILKNKFGK